jgi:hypothetical protein
VAHALVQAIHFALATGAPYREPEQEVLKEFQRQRLIRDHTRRLRRLGCWLPVEKFTPLKDWYASHCLPSLDPPPAQRRGRKPKSSQAPHHAEGQS